MKFVFSACLVLVLGIAAYYLSSGKNETAETPDVQTQPGIAVVQLPEEAEEQTALEAPGNPASSELNTCAIEGLDENTVVTALYLDSHDVESNTFNFSVSNFHTVPIVVLMIGRDSGYHFLSLPSRIPDEMVSSSGWTGIAGAGEESAYITYRWIGDPNAGASIPGGTTTSGFKVRMPASYPADEAKYRDLLDADNRPVLEMNLESAPFWVRYSDGSCSWGKVEARIQNKE